jgi:hypothetical protein
MTRDDIIRLAREARREQDYQIPNIFALERFAALVAAVEREACIKIIEAYQIPIGNSAAGEMARDWTYDALKEIRDEIRARGEK